MQLTRDGGRWQITDTQGNVLGRLSRAFTQAEGAQFLKGEIAAILSWRRKDGEEDFDRHLRRDAWEVILHELIFKTLP